MTDQIAPTVERTEGDKAVVTHDEDPAYLRDNLKMTRFMVIVALWLGAGAWMLQYDLSYGGTVLGMEPFLATFGTCTMVPNPTTGALMQKCALTATAQSMSAISTLFTAFGAAFSALPGNYLGRRRTIQFACCIIVIGAAGQCGTAGNYVAYNVCKCITTFGVGHLVAICPMYGCEIAAPQVRGALVALFDVGLVAGQLFASGVCAGTSKIPNDWAWRTVVIIQIPVAVIYALTIMIFPESPRWLLTKDRVDEARISFGRIYEKKIPIRRQSLPKFAKSNCT